jgi:3-deoxy-D-manno-octulosonic-acid transferase
MLTSLTYRFLTDIGAPFIGLYLLGRRARGREDANRFPERLGRASQQRPEGKLVWCHAASVGEAMSVLSLIGELRERFPSWRILLTTGTVTSARMLASRLPECVIHQYMPVDRWSYVRRFLDHWRPDLALWVESEIWPNMLTALGKWRIPAVLLNGRLSEKSFRRWSLMRPWAEALLGTFALGLAQTKVEQERFAALGLRDARCIGNLKYAASPLPCDESELNRLKVQIGNRKVWLMASTHPGEDETALAVHEQLRARWPDILTIIVPRHAARAESIEHLIVKQGSTCTRRTNQHILTPDTAFYLGDTMGEMGLFYRLAPVTCLGGSFTWGGHNPIEPAQLGSAMVFGPSMTNFDEIAREFVAADAAIQVRRPDDLPAIIERLLASPEMAPHMAAVARALAEQKSGVLDETLRILKPFLTGNRA